MDTRACPRRQQLGEGTAVDEIDGAADLARVATGIEEAIRSAER